MISSGRRFVVLLIALLWVGFANAEVSVTATVDRNSLRQGDTVTLIVSVSSEDSVTIGNMRLPDFKNFNLLNQWKSSQTQSTFTNGKFQVQRSQNYNYTLAPTSKGNFKINPVEVYINEKLYKTKPITIQVAGGRAKPQQNQNSPFGKDPFEKMDEMEKMFSQLLNRQGGGRGGGFESEPGNPKEAFFIQLNVDKTTVYAGEQVTASWYLYTNRTITEIDTLKYPTLSGFWKEDIEMVTRLNYSNEVINGVAYKKALLASFALFPIKPGKVKIDEYKARCKVLGSRGVFGSGKTYTYTKISKPLKITVLPLPKNNQPKDFSGAVGDFAVSAKVADSKGGYRVNQPITYKIKFEGRGNAKLIDLPNIEMPTSLELYDTKESSKFYKSGKSFKEFELLIIPREEGAGQIPAFSVSLFSPKTKSYYTKKIAAIRIDVSPAKNDGQFNDKIAKAGANQPLIKEYQPSLVLGWTSNIAGIENISAYLTIIVYALCFLILFWKYLNAFEIIGRKKNLTQAIDQRFKKVKKLIQKDEWRRCGLELTSSYNYVLGELSGVGGASLKLDQLILKLPPSVQRDYGNQIKKELSRLEVISFAPEDIVGSLKETDKLNKMLKDTEVLLNKIIKHQEDEV